MIRFRGPLLFLCSLIAGGLLFFFSLRLSSGGGSPEGYAALALDEGAGDRETAAALEKALDRPVISESSQWVLLNNFGGLERIPLEDYGERLELFDPRRDGYAGKLSRFFVRDGKRWFFIPLDGKFPGALPSFDPGERLKKKVARALNPAPGGTPPSFLLELKPRDRPLGFLVLHFVLALGIALVFSPGRPGPAGRPRRKTPRPFAGPSPGGRRLLLLAPLMLPLSLWGAPGFAFLALFLLLSVLLADPLKEWRVRSPGLRAGLGPYRSRILLSLPLAVFLALILWTGGMPPLLVSLNFLGLTLFYLCSLGLEIRRNFPSRGGASRRFVPLPILYPPAFFPRFPGPFPAGEKRGKLFSRPSCLAALNSLSGRNGAGLMLPFALASCLAAFSGFPGPKLPALKEPEPPSGWPCLVREEDYLAHALFQAEFSYRPLEFQGEGTEPGYFSYTLGEDGLVAGSFPAGWESPESPEIPPFPLADLSGFLAAWDARGPAEGGGAGIFSLAGRPLGDLVSPLLAFLLAFPSFLGGGRGRTYDDKRIAA
jgi:hypothetical protein